MPTSPDHYDGPPPLVFCNRCAEPVFGDYYRQHVCPADAAPLADDTCTSPAWTIGLALLVALGVACGLLFVAALIAAGLQAVGL